MFPLGLVRTYCHDKGSDNYTTKLGKFCKEQRLKLKQHNVALLSEVASNRIKNLFDYNGPAHVTQFLRYAIRARSVRTA